jgi:hypothetical protein
MRFFCVQPVEISVDSYYNFICSTLKQKEHLKYIEYCEKSWFENFREKNNVYKYLYRLKNTDNSNNSFSLLELENELKEQKNYINDVDISKYLLKESSDYAVYFDIRLSYFIIVYDLDFSFPETIFKKLLVGKTNLYIEMRKWFVQDSHESELLEWVVSTRKDVKKLIVLFSKQFTFQLQNNQLEIPKSTGNITYFYNDALYSLQKQIIKVNESAERLYIHKEAIYKDDRVEVYFYGRFHSIFVKGEESYHRYMPIQFHIQYVWYILLYFNNIMDELNLKLLENDEDFLVKKDMHIIDKIINKIQMLGIINERFCSAIEVDNDKIYQKIASLWNLNKNLKNSKEYMIFFKDFIEREYTKKISQAQKKQNQILFIISILQIAALISVWNDYLTLLNEESIKNIDEILYLFFNEKENLMIFNEYSPLIILFIIFLITMYILWRKK